MPPDPISDWLAQLKAEAARRDIELSTDIDGRSFHFELGNEDPVLGKVRRSSAENRNYESEQGEKHIWQRFETEQDRLVDNPDQRICSIQLDLQTSGEYNPERDHFLFIPGELILSETYDKGDQKIYIEDEGSYSGPLGQYTDDWDALFSYVRGELGVWRGESQDPELDSQETDYWDLVENKQTAMDAFLDESTEANLKAVLETFWTMRPGPEVDWQLETWFLSDHDPEEVARIIEESAEADEIGRLTKINGFGIAVASEALRAVRPNQFAILNDPAHRGMDVLGYNPPEPTSASPTAYEGFRANVEAAIEDFDLIDVAGEIEGLNIPGWATNYQIADHLFYRHTDEQYAFELYDLVDKGPDPDGSLGERITPPDFSIDLPTDLYFHEQEEARLKQQINAALNSGKHIIFTGPPGTGKSKLARYIAQEAEDYDQVDGHVFTTATAEWTTFDTIGGYVPADTEGGENRHLEFDPRLFLRCFRDDQGDVQNRWLVIDELNRANIDKALGPLFSVLAKDSVELPYERNHRVQIDWVDESTPKDSLTAIEADRDRFPMTPSWWLIGTMNTVDKTSLYDLSFAFMRRFNFIHVGVPDLTLDSGHVNRAILDPDEQTNYATTWMRDDQSLKGILEEYHEELAVIWSIVNEHRTIGPAIVLDMIQHISAHEGGDPKTPLTSAVISLVFPQLEGLREQDQRDLFDELERGRTIADATGGGETAIDLRLDHEYLQRKAEDMFDIDL